MTILIGRISNPNDNFGSPIKKHYNFQDLVMGGMDHPLKYRVDSRPGRYLIMKNILLSILAGLILITGVSCTDGGGGFTPRSVADDPRYTGAKNEDGFLFTHDDENGHLQELKDQIDPEVAQNKELVDALKDVTFSLESELKIKLTFEGEYSEMEETLELKEASGNEVSKEGEDWDLVWKCLESCSEVRLVLTHKESDGKLGLVLKSRQETFSLASEKQELKSELLGKLQTAVLENKEATFHSFVVAWGMARFGFEIAEDFCFSGDLVETNEGSILLRSECHKTLKGDLLGNGLGAYFFRFTEKTESLYLTLGYQKGSLPEEQEQKIGETQVVPVDLALPYTQAILKDQSHPVLTEHKEKWKKTNRLSRFMQQMALKFPSLQPLFEKDALVPNEMIFITLVESNYFVAEPLYQVAKGRKLRLSANGKKYCKKSIPDIASFTHDRALGPWQFRRCTGAQYGLKTYPDVPVTDVRDERGDLEKSTEAAVKYLSKLLTRFHKDPKLALAGYNFGGSGTERKQACLVSGKCSEKDRTKKEAFDRFHEVTKKTDITFWMLDEFNMLPKETSDYVKKIVSAQLMNIEGEYEQKKED